MSKTTKNAKSENKAAEMRAVADKALAEKRAAIRQSALYGRMRKAVEAAVEEASSAGSYGTVIPAAKVPGELGSPDTTVGDLICGCESPKAVADALAEDFEEQGFTVLRVFGCPVAVAWDKPDAE